MKIGRMGSAPSSRGSAQKSNLHQIRLINVLYGHRFLPDSRRQGFQPNRAAFVKADQGFQHPSIISIQT